MSVLVFLLVLSANVANGSNILAIFPTPSYSHQITYRSYTLELHSRGHNLTVVTTDPIRDPNLKNYREIDVSFYYQHWNKRYQFASDKARLLRWVPELFLITFAGTMSEICEMYLSHPEVNRLIRENNRFDLFIVEFGISSCFYPFAKFSDNNFIGIFSMSHGTIVHSNIGNIASASYIPDPLLGHLSRMDFAARFRATIYQMVSWIVYFSIMRDHTRIARKYFGEDLPPTVVYERNVSAVLLNNHYTVTFPRPMVPNLIDIGGPALHLLRRNPQPLPKDIQEFMDGAKDGVVYFSLGSNVRSDGMPDNKRRIFMEAFRRINQKVIWKWESDALPGKPDNVKIGKWFSQPDILAHPNLKLFITQGGLQSMSEAIYNKVPMIVIPFFADQEMNAKKLVSEGVAIRVDYENLELETFFSALNEVLNNKEYKERIIKFSALTQDQPENPLDRAIWWTEYVIRHKGARHLRSAAVDMPWYQYFLLDVIAFIIAVLLAILYALYFVAKLAKRVLFGKRKPKKD